MTEIVYVLDANVFIQAKNEYYPFDLVPGFWDTLTAEARNGRIRSIDRVQRELKKEGEDEPLWEWVKGNFQVAFYPTYGSDVIDAYREIIKWVHAQDQFRDYAKREFSTVADGWLVAYALANHYTIVTHEVFAPDIQKRVKIPNVCAAFGVQYVNTFEMLRTFRVRWGNLGSEADTTRLSG